MNLSKIFRNPMTWAQLIAAIAMAALMTLGYLGAFLSPESHTHDAPFLIVNEDKGLSMGGQTVNFGQQVLDGITTASPDTGDTIAWTVLDSRAAAEKQLGEDRAYAAIVIPETYSQQLAALMQAGSPAASQATAPAATPQSGTSATPAANATPAVAASTTNPTPAAPQPATIDVLMNTAAGAYPTNLAKSVSATVVTGVSQQVRTQLVQALGGDSAQIPVAMSSVLANPVVANVIDQQPTGPHTAGSNSPFYYALLLMLAGFVGMDVLYLGLEMVMGRSAVSKLVGMLRGDAVPLSPLQAWATRVILSAALAIVGSVAQAWVAIGILGMAVDQVAPLIFFGMLAIFTSALFTLLFLTALGTPGLLLAILVQTFVGAPSARGIFPKEMLPDFYQKAGTVLPLRYITDGVRAIVFYDANGAAGLTRGIVGLVIIGLVSLVGSGILAWFQERAARHAAAKVLAATA
ncbi:MAG: DUF3533 domain-containing protein [Thermomicrobiales bacterium]